MGAATYNVNPTHGNLIHPKKKFMHQIGSVKPHKADNVFKIHIQRSFKKLINLPEPKVWNKLSSVNILQDHLMIQIRRYGFFFDSETKFSPLRCLITPRGYLIIYTKESKLKGYAVKLCNANKVQICPVKKEGFCEVAIKWSYGEVRILLFKTLFDEWRHRIIEAFDGVDSMKASKPVRKACDVTHQNKIYDSVPATSNTSLPPSTYLRTLMDSKPITNKPFTSFDEIDASKQNQEQQLSASFVGSKSPFLDHFNQNNLTFGAFYQKFEPSPFEVKSEKKNFDEFPTISPMASSSQFVPFQQHNDSQKNQKQQQSSKLDLNLKKDKFGGVGRTVNLGTNNFVFNKNNNTFNDANKNSTIQLSDQVETFQNFDGPYKIRKSISEPDSMYYFVRRFIESNI